MAKDAAMGFLEAGGVEWPLDWMSLQYCAGQEDGIRLKLVQFRLGMKVAKIDENIRAGVAARVIGKGAHAILADTGV